MDSVRNFRLGDGQNRHPSYHFLTRALPAQFILCCAACFHNMAVGELQRTKRAFIAVLLALARVYKLVLTLFRGTHPRKSTAAGQ